MAVDAGMRITTMLLLSVIPASSLDDTLAGLVPVM